MVLGKYRSSIERMNAPYRGVTKREDAVNFELAALHDLFHIQKVAGGNPRFLGHKHYIQNNLSAIYVGETNVKTNTPTAGTFYNRIGEVEDANELADWSIRNGGEIHKEDNRYRLKANGLQAGVALTKIVTVNPGDIIQMRFKATSIKENNTIIALGALNFSNDGDDLDFYPLSAFKGGSYIEKRLHCQSRQDIQLVVYIAHETTQGSPVEWQVNDFSVNWLSESLVSINGLENTVKPALEVADLTLSYIDEEIQKRGGRT